MNRSFEFDVFLSHSKHDKSLVREVAERLRADGLKVWFDEWEIKAGDSIPSKIDEGLENSKNLVLFLSKHAFGSDWAQLESGTFRFRDPLNTSRRFIPVRIDSSPIKGSLAQFLYLDWKKNTTTAYEALLEACSNQTVSPKDHERRTVQRNLSKATTELKEKIKKFVRGDQIPQSGGWPLSQRTPFEYVKGRQPTSFESEEGGIISTYIAIRALKHAGIKVAPTRSPFREALSYLESRQDPHSAGFGRFDDDFRGRRLVPTWRHTALAAATMIEMEASPTIIRSAFDALAQLDSEDLLSDHCPAMSAAAYLAAWRTFLCSSWSRSHLDDSERNRYQQLSKRNRRNLYDYLEGEITSTTNPYAPFWKPYGGSDRMVLYTALITLDLLTWETDLEHEAVVFGLLSEVNERCSGTGIPYDLTRSAPDIGMSVYFSTLCFRPIIYEFLRSRSGGDSILKRAFRCLEFVDDNWRNPDCFHLTLTDTVANGLLLPDSVVFDAR